MIIGTVRLNRAELEIARLGFGTSRLHYLSSSRERQYLMAAAAERGLTHFDTAPLYGDGLAEREIGAFIRGRPVQITIATKFGIAPNWLIDHIPIIGRPLRIITSIARQFGLWPTHYCTMMREELRRSVERSLRRMRIEHIDMLLLHEPALDRLPEPYEIFEELQGLRQNGLVGAFGLAGPYSTIMPVAVKFPELAQVVQTGENEWSEADNIVPDITYGAMSIGPQTRLQSRPESGAAISRLVKALARRPQGALLISTTSLMHLDDIYRQLRSA
jgi:D-threo-aldose 1-dehydrogenase